MGFYCLYQGKVYKSGILLDANVQHEKQIVINNKISVNEILNYKDMLKNR